MKVKVVIELDTDIGDYELQYFSEKGESIEQEKLALIIQRVLDNWKLKFVD